MQCVKGYARGPRNSTMNDVLLADSLHSDAAKLTLRSSIVGTLAVSQPS